jgi:two-component system, LuxR family, response regulator FixJ
MAINREPANSAQRTDARPPIQEPTVFIVDDDDALRDSLVFLLRSVGLAAQAFATAEDFLAAYAPDQPGCLVVDVRLPGMSGIALQEALERREAPLPVILVTGYAEVPTAVKAMKRGAIDFIEKPFSNDVLLDCIRKAIDIDEERRRARAARTLVLARVERLSPREREVMHMIVAGTSTKEIAYDLGLSDKTVEVHRSHIMKKMQVGSVVELVRLGVGTLLQN